MNKIGLSRAQITQSEKEAVMKVLEHAYLGMGDDVRLFEAELKTYLNTNFELACVNTGTSALHLALQALGVGPGDEVLVPTLTYVATYQAIAATGAKAISCDVSLNNALLNLEDAETKVNKNTKALLYVHYASHVGDHDQLTQFCKSHNLRLIEDAAHSFGTSYKGKKVGAFGDITCFSFDGIKNLTCGEGGAIATSDSQVIALAKDARLLGVMNDTEKRFNSTRSWDFDVENQGWRYHMSNLMAAIGRAQLKRFDNDLKSKRIQLAKHYREILKNIEQIKLLEWDENGTTPFILPVRVPATSRDSLRAKLLENGIETGVHYKPNHLLTKFRDSKNKFPNAELLYSELITLPLHPNLNISDVERVVETLKMYLK